MNNKSVKFDDPPANTNLSKQIGKAREASYKPAAEAATLVIEAINECASKVRLYT